MINLKMFLSIFLCLLLFCYCEGPEGAQGLQGWQGYRGYQGYQGPPGESAPIPDFAGFYETINLEDRFMIFLGVDQFFAVYKESADINDPDKRYYFTKVTIAGMEKILTLPGYILEQIYTI